MPAKTKPSAKAKSRVPTASKITKTSKLQQKVVPKPVVTPTSAPVPAPAPTQTVLPPEVMIEYISESFAHVTEVPAIKWSANAATNAVAVTFVLHDLDSVATTGAFLDSSNRLDIDDVFHGGSDSDERGLLSRAIKTPAHDYDEVIHPWTEMDRVINDKLEIMSKDAPEATAAIVDLVFSMDGGEISEFAYERAYQWEGREISIRYVMKWVIGDVCYAYRPDGSGWKCVPGSSPEKIDHFEPNPQGARFLCLKLLV